MKIGTINPNSKEIRKETPEQRKERARLYHEQGAVIRRVATDRKKETQSGYRKHKGSWE